MARRKAQSVGENKSETMEITVSSTGDTGPAAAAKPVSQAVVPQKRKPLTPGQELYRARHDLLPPKDATFRYLVFSSQRTGSNYLCRRLCNVKDRFGLPSEYLNPKAIELMLPRLVPGSKPDDKVPLGRYLRRVERVRTTTDGAFGIKVQPMQLIGLVGRNRKAVMTFVERFDRVVLMTRRDKLGQAISGAIASATGQWFNDGEEPSLEPGQITRLFPVIAQNLARYIEEERLILDVGKAIGKPVLRIEYEDVEADGEMAFAGLVDFLTGGQPGEVCEESTLPVPKKAPGALAAALRGHFLDYIGGLPMVGRGDVEA